MYQRSINCKSKGSICWLGQCSQLIQLSWRWLHNQGCPSWTITAIVCVRVCTACSVKHVLCVWSTNWTNQWKPGDLYLGFEHLFRLSCILSCVLMIPVDFRNSLHLWCGIHHMQYHGPICLIHNGQPVHPHPPSPFPPLLYHCPSYSISCVPCCCHDHRCQGEVTLARERELEPQILLPYYLINQHTKVQWDVVSEEIRNEQLISKIKNLFSVSHTVNNVNPLI